MPRKLVKKKEKLSKEEQLYRSAVSLMDAVDCIDRFDIFVYSLNDAAKKFEKLGNYKDSQQRMEKCLSDSKEAANTGAEKTFNMAVKKFEMAKNKSDFIDIIEDFKLVRKFNYKKEECNKNIQYCQKCIRRIERIAVCKRYAIILCILAILFIIFVNTPIFPFVKNLWENIFSGA